MSLFDFANRLIEDRQHGRQRCGLAGPTWAEQCQKLATTDVQRNTAHGADAVEMLLHAAEDN